MCGSGWAGLVVLAQVCVCVWCVCQAGVLALWTAEAKEVQGLEEWRDLRNSRLSVYALLGMLQGRPCVCLCLPNMMLVVHSLPVCLPSILWPWLSIMFLFVCVPDLCVCVCVSRCVSVLRSVGYESGFCQSIVSSS